MSVAAVRARRWGPGCQRGENRDGVRVVVRHRGIGLGIAVERAGGDGISVMSPRGDEVSAVTSPFPSERITVAVPPPRFAVMPSWSPSPSRSPRGDGARVGSGHLDPAGVEGGAVGSPVKSATPGPTPWLATSMSGSAAKPGFELARVQAADGHAARIRAGDPARGVVRARAVDLARTVAEQGEKLIARLARERRHRGSRPASWSVPPNLDRRDRDRICGRPGDRSWRGPRVSCPERNHPSRRRAGSRRCSNPGSPRSGLSCCRC